MKQELFTLILDSLESKTLAYLVRDLEDGCEDWQYYPEDAPTEALQEEVKQIIEVLMKRGAELSEGGEPAFLQMIEQARDEQLEGDWTAQRDRQERQNWLKDYEVKE